MEEKNSNDHTYAGVFRHRGRLFEPLKLNDVVHISSILFHDFLAGTNVEARPRGHILVPRQT